MISKKTLSVFIIGLMILPILINIPISTGYGSTYIAVNPSKVRSGDNVYVRGYNFNSYQQVDICWNTTDDYNYLGSAKADAWGRFSFKFLMQETYPGVYEIIVITNPDIYTKEIEVIATSPLDQRLVDMINALSLDLKDINDTLNEIYTEVINIEAKLDEGGSFFTFVDDWFKTIQTGVNETDKECLEVEIQTIERDMVLNFVGFPEVDIFSTNIGGSDYQSIVYVITSLSGQRIAPTSISAHVKDGNQYIWAISYWTVDDDVDDIKDVFIGAFDAVEPGSYLVVVDVEYDDPLSGLTYYGTGSYIIECTATLTPD